MNKNENICKFTPSDVPYGDLDVVNFVHERIADFPDVFLVQTVYALRIATEGNGELKTSYGDFPISRGDLFFTFQAKPFMIKNCGGLQYIYISFFGQRADKLLNRIKVSATAPVIHGFESLIPFWEDAIGRADDNTIDLLAESVLLYTLSRLCAAPVSSAGKTKLTPAEHVKEYADAHYFEKDLTLSSVSRQFLYDSKYVSSSFKKLTGIGFSEYLKNLRLSHAFRMINAGFGSVKEIASFSGFGDPLYFSKVFKSTYGEAPSVYAAKAKKEKEG